MSPEYLIVSRIFNENEKEKIEEREDYYTLYAKEGNDNIVISSEPLDDDMWDLLPNNSGLVITPQKDQLKIEEFEF